MQKKFDRQKIPKIGKKSIICLEIEPNFFRTTGWSSYKNDFVNNILFVEHRCLSNFWESFFSLETFWTQQAGKCKNTWLPVKSTPFVLEVYWLRLIHQSIFDILYS